MPKYRINNLPKKIEWVFILIAHLILLKWILHVLSSAGTMEAYYLGFHFTGMAIYGALLIRTSAWLSMRRHKLEQK